MQQVIDAPTAMTSATVVNIHEITLFSARGDEKGTTPLSIVFLSLSPKLLVLSAD
jgi:hypothetical protein